MILLRTKIPSTFFFDNFLQETSGAQPHNITVTCLKQITACIQLASLLNHLSALTILLVSSSYSHSFVLKSVRKAKAVLTNNIFTLSHFRLEIELIL